MTFSQRLFTYCGIGALVWFLAQVGVLFCFFTYELIGKYFAIPLFYIAYWPSFLIQPLYQQHSSGWESGLGWPISCVVSLIGWLVLACLVAIVVQLVLSSRPTPKA